MKQASYRRSRTACLLLLILFLLSVLDKNPEIPSADEIPYLGYTQTTSVPCILEEDTGIIPDFINAEEKARKKTNKRKNEKEDSLLYSGKTKQNYYTV